MINEVVLKAIAKGEQQATEAEARMIAQELVELRRKAEQAANHYPAGLQALSGSL